MVQMSSDKLAENDDYLLSIILVSAGMMSLVVFMGIKLKWFRHRMTLEQPENHVQSQVLQRTNSVTEIRENCAVGVYRNFSEDAESLVIRQKPITSENSRPKSSNDRQSIFRLPFKSKFKISRFSSREDERDDRASSMQPVTTSMRPPSRVKDVEMLHKNEYMKAMIHESLQSRNSISMPDLSRRENLARESYQERSVDEFDEVKVINEVEEDGKNFEKSEKNFKINEKRNENSTNLPENSRENMKTQDQEAIFQKKVKFEEVSEIEEMKIVETEVFVQIEKSFSGNSEKSGYSENSENSRNSRYDKDLAEEENYANSYDLKKTVVEVEGKPEKQGKVNENFMEIQEFSSTSGEFKKVNYKKHSKLNESLENSQENSFDVYQEHLNNDENADYNEKLPNSNGKPGKSVKFDKNSENFDDSEYSEEIAANYDDNTPSFYENSSESYLNSEKEKINHELPPPTPMKRKSREFFDLSDGNLYENNFSIEENHQIEVEQPPVVKPRTKRLVYRTSDVSKEEDSYNIEVGTLQEVIKLSDEKPEKLGNDFSENSEEIFESSKKLIEDSKEFKGNHEKFDAKQEISGKFNQNSGNVDEKSGKFDNMYGKFDENHEVSGKFDENPGNVEDKSGKFDAITGKFNENSEKIVEKSETIAENLGEFYKISAESKDNFEISIEKNEKFSKNAKYVYEKLETSDENCTEFKKISKKSNESQTKSSETSGNYPEKPEKLPEISKIQLEPSRNSQQTLQISSDPISIPTMPKSILKSSETSSSPKTITFKNLPQTISDSDSDTTSSSDEDIWSQVDQHRYMLQTSRHKDTPPPLPKTPPPTAEEEEKQFSFA